MPPIDIEKTEPINLLRKECKNLPGTLPGAGIDLNKVGKSNCGIKTTSPDFKANDR
jgi:hypothetical protein